MTGEISISRGQLRWLLVLMALLPLFPTGWAVRLIFQNAERDAEVEIEETRDVYRQQLSYYVERFSLKGDTEERGAVLLAYLVRLFGPHVPLTVVAPDEQGGLRWYSGPLAGDEAIRVTVSNGTFEGWSVILDGTAISASSLGEYRRGAIIRAGGVVLLVVGVAGLSYISVSRRLKIHALRSDLMSLVAHEFKTPLASMRVLLENLESGAVEDEERRRDYLSLLLKENERLSTFTEQFLLYTRLEQGELELPQETLRLDDVARSAVDALAVKIHSSDASVELVRCEPLEVRGNRESLRTVVGNLVDNAVKYAGSHPTVQLSCRQEGAEARLSVEDDGTRIPDEERERIFKGFYQSDQMLNRRGGGVGLGLAISRLLVERMGGRLWLMEHEGAERGNVFMIALPLESAPDSPA